VAHGVKTLRFEQVLRISRWSLALTAATMPLYVVRWRIGPLPTTLLEALIVLTVGLYIASLVLRQAPAPGRTSLDLAIGILLVAGLIGVFVAPDHRGAAGIFRAYLVEPVVMYYVAIALLASGAAIDALLGAWAVGASLLALGQVAVLARAYLANHVVLGHVASFLDINPNSIALYLGPLVGVAAGFVLFGTGRRRWAAACVMVVLLAGDVATLSRGALLALAALAVAAVLSLRVPWQRVAILGGAAAMAVVLYEAPLVGPRLRHALDPSNGTFDVRGEIWTATARMLRDRPLFGAGINAYQSTMVPYRRPYPTLSPEPYPHNIFLTTWTELGLLGLAAFAYILVALIVMPFRALTRANDAAKPLLWGTGAAFVMLLVHGLVDSPYWKNDLSLEFWILAALEIAALRMVYSAGRAPK